ncbi:DUF4352 domain-containing protein [Streptomyces iconiensis]|uniref:DUF4352 domain-containing protein n=1 Tax=Streptomyces iconiensis TaxID=1384038 RepID=A0ABT7A5D1_9ACTN|nr:DUF4352 domain-containing protein [Streptomyces iconiensis]MDJ1136529.1 DUF4352 domain-containing protein [Streptomyces iconiensis]
MSIRLSPRTRRPSPRVRLVAATATALLAMGGLSACELDEPTTEKASSSSGAEAKGSGGGKGKGGGQAEKGPRAAGDTAVYGDKGLKVTVAAPAPFTPGAYAAGHKQANQAYKVKVTLENTGSGKLDTELVSVGARQGEAGETTAGIFDGENVGAGFSGKLLPGRKATATYGFDATKAAKNLDIEVSVNDFETEPAQWSLTL